MLFVKLILAHLLSCFLIIPRSWQKGMHFNNLKTPALYLRAVVFGIISGLLLCQDDVSYTWLLLVPVHLLLDILQLYIKEKSNGRRAFFVGELLHITAYIIYFRIINSTAWDIGNLYNQRSLIIFTGFVFLSFPAAAIIREFISIWSPSNGDEEGTSLENAGKYIGILERFFVFTFVITNHWEAIGFLLAAKSVFRFGDLKESKDRKLTEYILIGTLLSFGIAVGVGFLCL